MTDQAATLRDDLKRHSNKLQNDAQMKIRITQEAYVGHCSSAIQEAVRAEVNAAITRFRADPDYFNHYSSSKDTANSDANNGNINDNQNQMSKVTQNRASSSSDILDGVNAIWTTSLDFTV